MIVVSVSMLMSKITRKKAYIIFIIILDMILVIPNIIYIYKCYPIKSSITANPEFTDNANESVLNLIPAGKKVFSVNDPFKGQYNGFYSAYMWHNSYAVLKINNGELKLTDYILSFDYVLYNKNGHMDIDNKELTTILKSAGESNPFLVLFAETDTHILYKVNKKLEKDKVIQEETFSSPRKSKTSRPAIFRIKQKQDIYIIS